MPASPDRFDSPPVTDATNIEQTIFVQIGEDTGLDTSLKLHTGLSNPMPSDVDDGKWSEFIAVGWLMNLSNLSESSRESAEGFQIVLKFPPPGDTLGLQGTDSSQYDERRSTLISLMHAVDLVDTPICIWILEKNIHDESTPTPRPLIVGHISTPRVTPVNISFVCYTAGKLLDKTWDAPTLWNDYHQNDLNPRIKNNDGSLADKRDDYGVEISGELTEEDGAFKFTNQSHAELGVDFP